MARGTGTYKGLGLPSFGNPTLKGVSTADVLTIEHSTADQGNFLVFRNSASSLFPESTLVASDLLRFTSGGGLIALPESTNEWAFSSDGVQRGNKLNVITLTSGVNRTLATSESGSFVQMLTKNDTSVYIILPANPPVGTYFDIFVSSQDTTGDVTITSTGGPSTIMLQGTPTSVLSTVESLSPATTQGGYIRMLFQATSQWLAIPYGGGFSDANTTDLTLPDMEMGHWYDGTTIA